MINSTTHHGSAESWETAKLIPHCYAKPFAEGSMVSEQCHQLVDGEAVVQQESLVLSDHCVLVITGLLIIIVGWYDEVLLNILL